MGARARILRQGISVVMAKKNKTGSRQLSPIDPVEPPEPVKGRGGKKTATKKTAAKKSAVKQSAAPRSGGKKKAEKLPTTGKTSAAPRAKKSGAKKKAAGQLTLTLSLSRARKLAGDLYQSATLAFWAEAIEAAPAAEREMLTQLQDAICDAADLLKQARSANPRHLNLYMIAFFDREGLPATPHFVSAAGEDEALEIFKSAHKGEIGRRKPRARLVPLLAAEPQLHD